MTGSVFSLWTTPNLNSFSNQIYLVSFMCLTVDTSFILKKNQILRNVLLISVTLRWHSGVKKHEIWTFKESIPWTIEIFCFCQVLTTFLLHADSCWVSLIQFLQKAQIEKQVKRQKWPFFWCKKYNFTFPQTHVS